MRSVTVSVGWMGTVHEYASRPGAEPIDDLADEAYGLADGEIALREGELVAVVRWSGATAAESVALARVVADQLPPVDVPADGHQPAPAIEAYPGPGGVMRSAMPSRTRSRP